jgi:hypothetical protein
LEAVFLFGINNYEGGYVFFLCPTSKTFKIFPSFWKGHWLFDAVTGEGGYAKLRWSHTAINVGPFSAAMIGVESSASGNLSDDFMFVLVTAFSR